MIISRLFGGAGNQLFQYAAARALADRLGVPLAVDRRYVGNGKERGDCLVHFANTRLDPPGGSFPPSKMDGALRYGLWRLFGKKPKLFREKGLGFDPAFFDLPDATYLHGYWQSERYFDDTQRLRADLTMTTPLDAPNAAMADRIAQAQTPVSVHVRRGDYMASGAYAACTPDYYRAAIETMATRAATPLTCFVFSNDPGWAEAQLELGHETVIVDLNDETTGHFDMHLMSRCAHHVIANSTFSWWAAWLNPSPSKTVIAPKTWFADPKLENPDLIPGGWLRL